MSCFRRFWVKEPRHSENSFAKKRYTSIVARDPVSEKQFSGCRIVWRMWAERPNRLLSGKDQSSKMKQFTAGRPRVSPLCRAHGDCQEAFAVSQLLWSPPAEMIASPIVELPSKEGQRPIYPKTRAYPKNNTKTSL